ncbi:MAG: glycoside hydrolase family 28 protein [bacterium]|nr:glycoside hydrolase family 28 protein [bacterium]
MECSILFVSCRSAVIRCFDGGLYHIQKPYRILLNGCECGTAEKTITSLYGLWPDTDYTAQLMDGETVTASVSFRTKEESVTLNVRRFGAVGDGVHDDTMAIQTAITCCPEKGRVLIPRGTYSVRPLFLKSHITVEWAEGAEMKLCTDRWQFPILPGTVESTDETRDYNYGSWEGNPLDMFAAALTGVEVEDVALIGPGLIDGQAQKSDWWMDRHIRRGAWRPRLLFLCRCRDITVQGLSFCNSPAWNLHPYFSQNLSFLDLSVSAPADSPNTDGFDPESCTNVTVAGVHFSLGDDCIAIKSGKIYMGARFQQPCENITISHCLMENGHGGVTAGSEMAGGVRNVRVQHCLMRNTDRGLRVKTRRGRGKDGVIDDIVFDHVQMDHVGAPFVVNCLYFCDPDGRTPWVQSREKQPVDDGTPRIGRIVFKHVQAENCGACAGYFLGLPEQPIESVTLEDSAFTFDPNAKPFEPAMAWGVEACVGRGIIAQYVDTINLRRVTIDAPEKLEPTEVQHINWEE